MADPVVELKSGFIRGLNEKHEDGFDYYAFKGIPYAEPPIGDLRFEDPIPVRKWTGTLDCKNYEPVCFQTDFLAQITSYSEDCLHLNVFTRAINNSNERKAVMVWSHTGNFAINSASDMYQGPEYLIRKDVVVVTINYRLGILGFLDLEDPIAPGNQGLKDQVMALRWVQQNIHLFGGNPDNVTVCGNSAGGASAHYLAMSPLTKGLMHKIICQSSVVYNTWTTVKDPLKNGIYICSLLGKKLEDPKEIKQFLKTVDTPFLLDVCERFWKIVESTTNRQTLFYLMIDMPLLMKVFTYLVLWVTTIEMASYSYKAMPRKQYFEMGNRDFETIIQYNAKEILDHYNLSPLQVRRLYYKSEPVTEKNIDNYVNYCSDVHFHQGIHRFVRVQAERSSAPTYLYIFSFDSPDKLSRNLFNDDIKGVCHLDELPFLFKMRIFDQFGLKHVTKGTKSYRIMEQMAEMWANFAKHGRPTIELSDLIPVHWKPVSNGTLLRYMNIDEDLTMQYTVNVEEKWLSAKQIKV